LIKDLKQNNFEMPSSESEYSGSDEDMPSYEDVEKIFFTELDNEYVAVINRKKARIDILNYIAMSFGKIIRRSGIDINITKFPQYDYIISNMFSIHKDFVEPMYYFDTQKFIELVLDEENEQFHESMISFERCDISILNSFKEANLDKTILDFQSYCKRWSIEHKLLYDGLLCGNILTYSEFQLFSE
jgi:hypothetical protein